MKNDMHKRDGFKKIGNTALETDQYRDVLNQISQDRKTHEELQAAHLQNEITTRAENHLSSLQRMLKEMSTFNMSSTWQEKVLSDISK